MTDFVADASAIDVDALRASGHSVCRVPMRTRGLVRGADGGLVEGDIDSGRAVMVRGPRPVPFEGFKDSVNHMDAAATYQAIRMARESLSDEWAGLSKVDGREPSRARWWR